ALRPALSPPVPWRRRMSRREISAAHQPPLAVEHYDLDRDVAALNHLHGSPLRRMRHHVAERYAFDLGMGESLRCRVRRYDALTQVSGATGYVGEARERYEIHRPALRVEIEQSLCKLGDLGDPARDGDARHRMSANVFEHAAHEVAHIDERDLRQ